MRRFFTAILLIFAMAVPAAGETIRWVDFDVPYESLEYALSQDILTAQQENTFPGSTAWLWRDAVPGENAACLR